VCNGYLPTELADEEARKTSCAECCDCWCHCAFTNPDGSDRDDAEALRAPQNSAPQIISNTEQLWAVSKSAAVVICVQY
jgi:hypothetical protein